MKALDSDKRAVDPNIKVRVKSHGTGADIGSIKMVMEPFDAFAFEEGLHAREAVIATQVLAVSHGVTQRRKILRTAMAIGADFAILEQTDAELQPLTVAKLLRSLANNEQPQLIILGEPAIEDVCNQTGQMLAASLRWPQVTLASKFVTKSGEATVPREVDGDVEACNDFATAYTTALRMNRPR